MRGSKLITALLSLEIDKYEYVACEEILPVDQNRIVEQANSAYSPYDKALEKQAKTIEDASENQIKIKINHRFIF